MRHDQVIRRWRAAEFARPAREPPLRQHGGEHGMHWHPPLAVRLRYARVVVRGDDQPPERPEILAVGLVVVAPPEPGGLPVTEHTEPEQGVQHATVPRDARVADEPLELLALELGRGPPIRLRVRDLTEFVLRQDARRVRSRRDLVDLGGPVHRLQRPVDVAHRARSLLRRASRRPRRPSTTPPSKRRPIMPRSTAPPR